MRGKQESEVGGTQLARVGVSVGCGLYCLACGLHAQLSHAATKLISNRNQHLFSSSWSPDYWETMGSLVGCLVGGASLCYMGRRTSMQRVALPVLTAAIIITTITSATSHSHSHNITSTFTPAHLCALQIFLQNVSTSLSMIIPPIYILETICWRPLHFKSTAVAILLALTQIPAAFADWVGCLGAIQSDGYTASIIGSVLVSATFALISTIAIESPRWLLQVKDRSDEATLAINSLWAGRVDRHEIDTQLDEMRVEMQSSRRLWAREWYLRPMVISCCLLVIVQLMGFDAFAFYSDWAYQYSRLTTATAVTSTAAITSSVRLGTVCVATALLFWWPGPKCVSVMLLVTTTLLTVCLLSMGLFLYAVEQGICRTGQLAQLPLLLLLLYQTSFWAGVGSSSLSISVAVVPPKLRTIVLTISLTVYQMTSYFTDIFLPLMINVLHPFGVFWFHAGLAGVGLIYILFVIIPELTDAAKRHHHHHHPHPTIQTIL